MPPYDAGCGERPTAPRTDTPSHHEHHHDLPHGLLYGAMIATPLWLMILKGFGLI